MTISLFLGVLPLVSMLTIAQHGTAVRPVIKADVRLVEVYAAVYDRRGKPVTGLTADRFVVADNGEPQQILSFESAGSGLSCALLLDMTGSMSRALPVVKNAVMHLVDELGADDWCALYGFNTSLRRLHEFTTDKTAIKRAVLNIRAEGATALFDAIAQVARDLAGRKGKKAMVVFTDGEDNSSYLHATTAMARARKVGVPLYTVAEGEALQSEDLLEELAQISKRTGGLAYSAKRSDQIVKIFQDISRDLSHTYMIAYPAPPSNGSDWRTIQLSVKGSNDYRIRAKEGYDPN